MRCLSPYQATSLDKGPRVSDSDDLTGDKDSCVFRGSGGGVLSDWKERSAGLTRHQNSWPDRTMFVDRRCMRISSDLTGMHTMRYVGETVSGFIH